MIHGESVALELVYTPLFRAARLPADPVEGVVILPEKLTVTTSEAQVQALVNLKVLDSLPAPLSRVTIQDGAPYVRFAAGVERFIGSFWLNLPWVHGLPTERSAADVSRGTRKDRK
jgi:hypothetical protein